jgi:hypothetical protein
LPPDLNVSISDPLLEQFQLTSPSLTNLMEDVAGFLAVLRKKNQPLPEHFREEIKDVIRRAEAEIAVLDQDLESLQKSLPARRASLKNLEAILSERIKQGERIDPSIYDTDIFEKRIAELQTKDIPQNRERLLAAFILLDLIIRTEEHELRKMIQNRSFDADVQKALRDLKLTESALSPTEAADLARRQHELDQTTHQLDVLKDIFGDEAGLPPIRQPVQVEDDRADIRRAIAELRQKDEYSDWILRVISLFQKELAFLSLMQTRARVHAMTLVPVSITPEEAFRISAENRLDWMNRKSQLVDKWRQIDITADKLKGVLSLSFDGTLGTADKNGVNFSKNSSNLSVGLKWDSPLNRYEQMMDYRRSQISYQSARRDYYTYVDTVHADLRNTLRDVQMSQINFEIGRNAVLVGTTRVDVMQLQMERPAQRGGRIDTNTSNQLINALQGLMDSQNSFLDTWVTFQTRRMLLDLYMGTMSLDEQGRWIEPNAMEAFAPNQPQLAPVLPVPVLETPRLNRHYVE